VFVSQKLALRLEARMIYTSKTTATFASGAMTHLVGSVGLSFFDHGGWKPPDSDKDGVIDRRVVIRGRLLAVRHQQMANGGWVGTFEDITQLGEGQDDIDRQLAQLSSGAQVDDELAKMKADLGKGGDAPALEQGQGQEQAKS